jgi:DNA-directed RNA polymerase specialized sigma24 family protein
VLHNGNKEVHSGKIMFFIGVKIRYIMAKLYIGQKCSFCWRVDRQKRNDVLDAVITLVSSLSAHEKKQVLSKLIGEDALPISIFRSSLSPLEAIVFYLKHEKKKSITAIATLLQRKRSTLYTTYYKASKKLTGELDISDTSVLVPLSTFTNRKFAVLESLVAYLKEQRGMNLREIATALGKSYSTVRTVSMRYTKKW